MDSIFNQPKLVVTIPDEVKNALIQNAAPYPLPEGKRFQYGTAGVSSSLSRIANSLLLLYSFA
jgi:hypothetical protein